MHKNYNRHHNNHREHGDRADRYMKEHGLERKESSKGIGSRIKEKLHEKVERYQQRNTPERRRERITSLALEAKEEQYKTAISKAKSARKSMGVFGGGRVPRATRPRHARHTSSGTQQSFSGMNDLFGTNESHITRKATAKQPRAWSGMDDLF